MKYERFNELINGPLNHPVLPCRINRLDMALFAVVQATGAAGEEALEAWCRDRVERDERIKEQLTKGVQHD